MRSGLLKVECSLGERFRFASLLFAAALLVVAIFPHGSITAGEPAYDFLAGLKQRGYHDIALDYLEAMKTSRLAPAELRTSIPYEKAIVMVAASRQQADAEVRKRMLSEAEALLKGFTGSNPSGAKINAARGELGKLIVERARLRAEQGKKANDRKLLVESRTLYDEAFKVLADLQTSVRDELEEIPKVLDLKDRQQAALAAKRRQLRADNLQTELLAAAIREECADTVPEGSGEAKAFLSEAANLYEAIYKGYRTRLAGLYARLYQGRCNQRLGKLRDALGYYGELLDQPDKAEFYDLKTKTLRRAMECWLAPSQKKYLVAIKQTNAWLQVTPKNKAQAVDALAIRLNLARAYKLQADDNAEDKRLARTSIDNATREAMFVAKVPSEFREEATALVAKLGGRMAADANLGPQDFDAAKTKGKEHLDNIAPAAAKYTAAKSDTEKEAAKKALDEASVGALQNFRLALRLADRETPQTEVNLVRYFLCYLHYQNREYFEAALLGDFVSARYPDSPAAKQCGQIALACYVQLYRDNPDAAPEFEINRVVATAKRIADTWPGEKEAVDALTTLVPFMISGGDLLAAKQFAERIPPASAERLKAELSTGQAMWGRVLELATLVAQARRDPSVLQNAITAGDLPEGSTIKNLESEIAELRQNASDLLTAGLARLPAEPSIDVATLTAALSLAQAQLESLKPVDALKTLEHPKYGPLTLVDAENSAASDPQFVEETYRTALRSAVGALGSSDGATAEKAERLVTAMQNAVGTDAAGIQRLLSVFVALAQDIQKQLAASESEADKQKLSQVFEAFMTQLSDGSADLAVLNWVAETFAKMAAGFEVNETVTPEASRYYEKSITAYDNIIAKVKVDEQTAMAIELKKADGYRKLSRFQESLDIYMKVLKQNPKMLNVQVRAAELLQAWGEQDASKYREAIYGSGGAAPNQTIWGWAKIAKISVNYEQFRLTFYQARYGIAACKFGPATKKPGPEKSKASSEAIKILQQTMQLYPDLDDGQWLEKYQAFLKRLGA